MSWPFSLEIKVRYRDIDGMRHLNNAVYFTYLEQCRTEYYMKLVEGKKISDLGFILVSAKCDYKSPVSIEDEVMVYIRPSEIGNTSWKFEYEVREKNTDRLMAKGETVQIAYDYKKGKKKRIDDNLRQKLLEDMEK